MKRLIHKYKKNIIILLSFLIPCAIMTTIFYLKGFFTDKAIISADLRAQYYPLFGYVKGIYSGINSVFYSFNKGVGGTMFGTFFYYMSSPLNILIKFISKERIMDFITVMIILKISLCGISMCIYMSKRYNEYNLKILVFSICYALMGYNLNYYMNIMWLDVVFLAPLVLIGIDKIIQKNKPYIYSIFLFLSIVSNYYMAYMLCLFSVLYFIYELLNQYDYKENKRIIIQKTKIFIISSILTGLMCSFFLIPCMIESMNYGRSESLDKIFTFDYNFFDLFTKSYIGSLNLTNILNYTSMNLYCSEFFLVILFIYILSKTKNKKKKKLSIVFILIMILPVFIGVLNWTWHLFTIPTYLSYRYSFLLCIFIIKLCYEEEKNIIINKKNTTLFLSIYIIISLYLIMITEVGEYYDFLNYKLIILSLIFVITYIILLYNRTRKKVTNNLILIIVLFEMILNTSIIFKTIRPLEKSIIDNYKEPMNEFSKYNDKNYRIESAFFETMNESLLYGYKGIGNFLSTTNSRIIQFSFHTGNNESTEFANNYNYQKQNYILDSLLGIKYMIYPNKVNNYELIKLFKINDVDAFLYKNNNAYNLGYTIKNKCNNLELNKFYDNEIYNCIFDKNEEFYKEIKYFENKEQIIKYNTKENEYIYIWIDELTKEEQEQFKKENISKINDIVYSTDKYVTFQSKNKILEIIKPDNIDTTKIKAYYFDYEKFYNQGKPVSLDIKEYKKNELEAEILINNDEILMITLPYEKGFKIEVDGKPTDYYMVADSFIGFDLKEGYHKISLKYEQPGLKLGIGISCISLIFNMMYNILIYKKKC